MSSTFFSDTLHTPSPLIFTTSLPLSLQLAAQISEREVLVQQLEMLGSQLKLSNQQVQELEATGDQLQQDIFTTRQSLEQLEGQHHQVGRKTQGGGQKPIALQLVTWWRNREIV